MTKYVCMWNKNYSFCLELKQNPISFIRKRESIFMFYIFLLLPNVIIALLLFYFVSFVWVYVCVCACLCLFPLFLSCILYSYPPNCSFVSRPHLFIFFFVCQYSLWLYGFKLFMLLLLLLFLYIISLNNYL